MISLEYKYNFFIRMGLEIYLEVTLLALLSASNLQLVNFTSVVNTLITLLFLVIVLVFMFWIPFKVVRDYAKIRLLGEKYCHKYWCLFGDFKSHSKYILFYNFYFCIRRFLYAIVIVFMQAYPMG